MKLPRKVRTKVNKAEYEAGLKESGYEMIGYGSFATVYGKRKSNQVIKVGDLGKNHNNDGYLAFLKNINNNNPHFPKIQSVQIFTHSDGNYYVVEMERLIHFHDVKHYNSKLARLGLMGDSYYGPLDDLQDLEFTPRTKHMKQVKRILKILFRKYDEDIHSGNVMWRKRGCGYQFVITDPVA
jgi:hypothetical protein